MLEVVTSAIALQRHFGAEGAARVLATIESQLDRWSPVGSTLRTEPVLETKRGTGTAVLLIGGDEIVPHHRAPNPVASRTLDPDRFVTNDDPYGGGIETGVPVGRIPDLGRQRLDDFLDLLRSDPPAASGQRTLAVTNSSWTNATRAALASWTESLTVRESPGWTAADPDWTGGSYQLCYFNLHGFAEHGAWQAFDHHKGTWLTTMSPGQADSQAVRGSVVFAENCYGANASTRPAQNSIASRMLQAGARAFVGSTGLAFSSHSMVHRAALANADLVGRLFIEAVTTLPVGEALWKAKRDLLDQPETVFALKSARQFILYGNPLTRVP